MNSIATKLIGTEYLNNYGEKFFIVDYKSSRDILIMFYDGFCKRTRMSSIKKGIVTNGNYKSAHCFQRIGEIHSTKQGDVEIVEYNHCEDVYIKFLASGSIVRTTYNALKKKYVRDNNQPTVCGVGVLGEVGQCSSFSNDVEYKTWCGMLTRCYNKKSHIEKPSYKECSVSDRFLTYYNFKEWCNGQVGCENKDWHLDKDILVKGNKVYSEDTCCFVPKEINLMFTNCKVNRGKYPIGVIKKGRKYYATSSAGGVKTVTNHLTIEEAFYAYKERKEANIKEVANKWKDKIDPRAYEALINYQVEITD